MKRRISRGCLTFLFFLFCINVNAQTEGKVTYYKIEKLTVETFKKWSESDKKVNNSQLVYSCIPSKIVGVKTQDNSKVIVSLKTFFTEVKKMEITSEEAMMQCASNRKP